ncbi:MAG TPA: hypothetical protein VGC57_15980 [Cellulomonas sp.]
MGRERSCWGDDGITLAELLVSMVIMSMTVLATVTLTVGMQQTDSKTRVRSDDTSAAQYAMRVISHDVPYALRPAVFASAMPSPVLVATDTTLAVVVDENGLDVPDGLVLVEITVANGRLTETRTAVDDLTSGDELAAALPSSGACAVRTCSTRVLVDGVRDGTGFRYLTSTGTVTTDADEVRSVEVTLVVATDADLQPTPSTHRQRIYLKND